MGLRLAKSKQIKSCIEEKKVDHQQHGPHLPTCIGQRRGAQDPPPASGRWSCRVRRLQHGVRQRKLHTHRGMEMESTVKLRGAHSIDKCICIHVQAYGSCTISLFNIGRMVETKKLSA